MARPTKITNEIVAKLEEAFRDDLTVEQSCAYAGIHKTTFYRHFSNDDDFATKMQRAKQYVYHLAKKNIIKSIKGGSVEDSKWYLNRKIVQEEALIIQKAISQEQNDSMFDIFG